MPATRLATRKFCGFVCQLDIKDNKTPGLNTSLYPSVLSILRPGFPESKDNRHYQMLSLVGTYTYLEAGCAVMTTLWLGRVVLQ